MLRVSNIKTAISRGIPDIESALLEKLSVKKSEVLSWQIHRQSLDARKRGRICFVFTVDVLLSDEEGCLRKCSDSDVVATPLIRYVPPEPGSGRISTPPAVVGMGPAGLFAALMLARMGYRPLIIERGAAVPERNSAVQRFWDSGSLDPECNVQFGEGGAGTFSDGKLTTLIRDIRCPMILEELVSLGAPPEIIYSHRPHIGTDNLQRVVVNLRKKIESLGGTIRFNSRLSDLAIEDGHIRRITVNGSESLDMQILILAPGHSARDTFGMLHKRGITMTAKPFSMGLRIEHPQSLIDDSQYHHAGHPCLGPADYRLVYHDPSGRSLYTFCMCPGGQVIAAASEEGGLVTNGMSVYARKGENANSALLVGVTPSDFGGNDPLCGIAFQRRWEEAAYRIGKGGYRAPAQLVGDFLRNRPSTVRGAVRPSYRPGITLTELSQCLPDYVITTMQAGIPEFDRKLKGFALSDALLTGVETRSSSPVRILRDDNMESSVRGLYPCGEGAGHAGGIISAAVDGIKAAEAVIRKYAPL